jgi:hypothetical protein
MITEKEPLYYCKEHQTIICNEIEMSKHLFQFHNSVVVKMEYVNQEKNSKQTIKDNIIRTLEIYSNMNNLQITKIELMLDQLMEK